MSKLKRFAVYWLPVLIWMGVIFSASGDSKSAQRSSRILEPLLRWLFPGIQAETMWAVILVVRKGAHLTVYAVLALLLWRAMRAVSARSSGWSWRVAGWAWLGTVLYAITDEVHQMFVPTRIGSSWDVVIDSTGGAAALLGLWAFGCWRKWWRASPRTTGRTQDSL